MRAEVQQFRVKTKDGWLINDNYNENYWQLRRFSWSAGSPYMQAQFNGCGSASTPILV